MLLKVSYLKSIMTLEVLFKDIYHRCPPVKKYNLWFRDCNLSKEPYNTHILTKLPISTRYLNTTALSVFQVYVWCLDHSGECFNVYHYLVGSILKTEFIAWNAESILLTCNKKNVCYSSFHIGDLVSYTVQL